MHCCGVFKVVTGILMPWNLHIVLKVVFRFLDNQLYQHISSILSGRAISLNTKIAFKGLVLILFDLNFTFLSFSKIHLNYSI